MRKKAPGLVGEEAIALRFVGARKQRQASAAAKLKGFQLLVVSTGQKWADKQLRDAFASLARPAAERLGERDQSKSASERHDRLQFQIELALDTTEGTALPGGKAGIQIVKADIGGLRIVTVSETAIDGINAVEQRVEAGNVDASWLRRFLGGGGGGGGGGGCDAHRRQQFGGSEARNRAAGIGVVAFNDEPEPIEAVQC
ncbi:hypothetical protein L1887_42444 [Cichorium endivia]|nr:hypothetical protein L1887_42444 [Cichorium endivia]